MVSLFINRLLQSSGLPITVGQFWWYSLIFWTFFALIWCCQSMLFWMLTPASPVYFSEAIYWLIELLYWWAATPLIIYCAERFSLLGNQRIGKVLRQVMIHLLIVSALYAFELGLEYVLLGPLMTRERGEAVTLHRMMTVFSLSLGTAFGQYMLLVVGYNVLTFAYRFRSLKEQHLQSELTNEQLQAQLANAQLQSLKMQLNPHFLFNTLHTVVSLMLRGQTRRAALMVTTLSDLLRRVLARQQANFLSLHDEMTLTRQYLSIQQIRFEDRLTVEYAVAPEAEDCLVPQLILQPLVENAITHGIADMTEGALIRVTVRRWADSVLIEVFDNGVGQHQIQDTSGTGLGLSNTLLRLQQAYGDKAQLRFEQPPEGTTTVTLLIPCSTSLADSPTAPNRHDSVSHAHY
ncbi:sensor histidine kinase [Larkinella soli]|uniref:sensor histidine kinase n=1 Tax=Larkinella soli TaxID=1770527 RepID=UPI001E5B06FA|nr:histidine kinase [Larkinella soli]